MSHRTAARRLPPMAARWTAVSTAILTGGICLAAVTVSSQTSSVAVAIVGVNIVDVVSGHILPHRTVVIKGRTIASVTADGAPPAGARVLDGRDTFLIPGLWDMHAHIEATGESSLALFIANGVTGIRDMGSDLDLILKTRESTASGRVLGPRIFAAGPILDDPPGDWPFRMRVKTAEDGRSAVQLLKRRGVDLIKVHDHTPRGAYFAIAEEARRQQLPLAGHLPAGVSAQEAIDAGQTDFEHLDNLNLWKPCSGGNEYVPEKCRPFFELLASRHIWQTPTLAAFAELATIGTPASTVSPEHMAYASQSLRKMWAGNQSLFATPDVARQLRAGAVVGAAVTRDMAAAGVGILTGCDAMIAGFCVHDELAAMVRGGMTPIAALQTATINPARYFGVEQTLGTIAPGRTADLVLLDANPLIDIANVARIRTVISAGRAFDRAELDKLLADVRIAASKR